MGAGRQTGKRTGRHDARQCLKELGHPIEVVAVEDGRLADRLSAFDPRDYIVFNWCEELPDVPHSEPEVAAVMGRLGFVFTGSSYDALASAYDKPRVKGLLDEAHLPTPPWSRNSSMGGNSTMRSGAMEGFPCSLRRRWNDHRETIALELLDLYLSRVASASPLGRGRRLDEP